MSKSIIKKVFQVICGTSRRPTVFHPEWYTRTKHRLSIQKVAAKYIKGATIDIGSGDRYYEKLIKGTCSSYLALDKVEYWGPENSNPAPDISGDAESIPVPDGQFDSAFLIKVLEHCLEYDKILKEANRVLKPGGHILITVPFLIWVHGSPYDYFRYTKNSLPIILERAGFSVIELNNTCGAGGGGAAISNTVTDTTHGFSKARKIFHIYCLGLVLSIFWQLTNIFAVIFDRLFPNPNYTFGYTIIAKKI